MISSSPRARRLEARGDIDDAVVVEIEPGHRPVGFGRRGLFHDVRRLAEVVEFDNAVALGIVDQISEHGAALLLRRGAMQHRREPGAVEDVVAEDQRAGVGADEIAADDEGLGETLRLRLDGIGEAHADAAAVAEEADKAVLVLGRGDHQHLANAGEHQHRQRVIDHRLVVDREQLLAGGDGGRIKPRAGAAGQDDALHDLVPPPSNLSNRRGHAVAQRLRLNAEPATKFRRAEHGIGRARRGRRIVAGGDRPEPRDLMAELRGLGEDHARRSRTR